MTDKQQELFQKMLEGKISVHVRDGEVIWFAIETNTHPVHGSLYSILTAGNKEWDDYAKAWEAYKQVPLVKTLG